MRWLTLLGLLFCACPERPDPPEDDDGGVPTSAEWPDGTVEILNARTMKPLTDSALESGAQGGFHVPIDYRVTGKTVTDVTFSVKVRRASDGRLVSRGQRVQDIDATAWTSGEVYVFMCPSPVGISVVDVPLNFEVIVTGAGGKVLGIAKADATLTCPEANRSFCDSICKG